MNTPNEMNLTLAAKFFHLRHHFNKNAEYITRKSQSRVHTSLSSIRNHFSLSWCNKVGWYPFFLQDVASCMHFKSIFQACGGNYSTTTFLAPHRWRNLLAHGLKETRRKRPKTNNLAISRRAYVGKPEFCVFTTLRLTKSSRRRFPKHSQSFTWQFSLIAWANFSRASSLATRCLLRRVFRLLDSVHNMHLRNPNADMCALGVVQEKMFMFIAEIGTIFQIDGNRSDARNIHENIRGATEPGRTGKIIFRRKIFRFLGVLLSGHRASASCFNKQTFRHSESCWTTAKCLLSIELQKFNFH